MTTEKITEVVGLAGALHLLADIKMTEAEATARGLVPVPVVDRERVRSMTMSERSAWASARRAST